MIELLSKHLEGYLDKLMIFWFCHKKGLSFSKLHGSIVKYLEM